MRATGRGEFSYALVPVMKRNSPARIVRWFTPAASAALVCVMTCVAIGLLIGMSPPTGRPPLGPLRRAEPKTYEFRFNVMMKTAIPRDLTVQERFDLVDAPIMMPILFLDTFNRVEAGSVRLSMLLDNREYTPRITYNSGHPMNTTLLTANIDQFRGQAIRWNLQFVTQVWSSQIDDAQAALIPWPDEWPAEVQDALKPQLLIESDDALFGSMVERAVGNRLKDMPPYIAAKELVRYCVNSIQPNGSGEFRGELSAIQGMALDGALLAAQNGRGSPHDVACVTVAVLRAAGIPARPVIGAEEDRRGHIRFVTWAEFYLPEVGWIPFDPLVMRGKGIRTMDARQPWPEFGTMKDLHDRVPLSRHFMPPVSSQAPGYPAVWGWDPRPTRPKLGNYTVNMTMISRGRGIDDPQ